ncbi:MAG: PAS domain S-box protein, partial [Burkholderiales bacterium]|nr:PAS domain S-box protein [Burkholderiales bacterium]
MSKKHIVPDIGERPAKLPELREEAHSLRALMKEDKISTEALNKMGIALAQFLDSSPVPTFVLDANHTITHWNKACEYVLGYSAAGMISTQKQWKPFYPEKRPVLADLMLNQHEAHPDLHRYYADINTPSQLIKGAYEAKDFFPNLGESGLWLHFTAAPLYNEDGKIVGAIETLEDITERCEAENALRQAQVN